MTLVTPQGIIEAPYDFCRPLFAGRTGALHAVPVSRSITQGSTDVAYIILVRYFQIFRPYTSMLCCIC